ncbi:MAG: formate dehydrogenase accessory sulfurtransferase FdhD, partial [Alphaproteobacteria bacterium]|nr:formate dehydrogenase accessory sulfurtransferase FdhD [Alphaproteobacteria bacterium]
MDNQVPQAIVRGAARRFERIGQAQIADYALANEVPVALVYNGISHAVMLSTPQDIEDLAYGFSLTEGIISAPDQLLDFETQATGSGLEARITISQRQMRQLESRRRSLSGATGCGLCGIESLAAVTREIPSPPRLPISPVSAAAIFAAMESLAEHQPLNRQTHAIHAAGFASRQGQVMLVREDVGRHNALDKLAGALVRQSLDPAAGIILLTSRCSFELVQKAAMLGCGMVVTISAPTGLAVELAATHGMT